MRINDAIKKEIQRYLRQMKWKHNDPKSVGCTDLSSNRECQVQYYRPSSRKKKKSQINNLILHLKELEKEQIESRVSTKKEIINIRIEINKIIQKV